METVDYLACNKPCVLVRVPVAETKHHDQSQWWYTPFIQHMGGRGRQISEFEVSFVYRGSSGAAGPTWRNWSLSPKQTKQPWTNQRTKANWEGKERVNSIFCSHVSRFLIKGSRGRNSGQVLKQRPVRRATYWLVPHELLGLLIQSRTTCTEVPKWVGPDPNSH